MKQIFRRIISSLSVMLLALNMCFQPINLPKTTNGSEINVCNAGNSEVDLPPDPPDPEMY